MRLLRFVTPHVQRAGVLELWAAKLRRLGLDGLRLDLDCTQRALAGMARPDRRTGGRAATAAAWGDGGARR